MSDLFGTGALIDGADLLRLLTRLGLDLGVTAAIVLLVHYRLYRNRDFVFTYFVLNVITFSMCALLRKVPTELGFALGLFAVFGILRYRTEEIRMRDLTYLFIVIGLGIINAVANKKISFAELMAVNGAIVGVAAMIELAPRGGRQLATPLLYDNLALLQHDRHRDLCQDVGRRTGFEVMTVQVHRVDLLRDAAELTVIHRAPRKTTAPRAQVQP